MDGFWNPEEIRQLATKHVGQAEILRVAASILEMEDEANNLRRSIENHMEELDGWYDLKTDARKAAVEAVAGIFEVQKQLAKGCAAAPVR